MRCRSIVIMTAVVWLAGCQTGGVEYYKATCIEQGHAAGSAQLDACVADRVAEMNRWNRVGYRSGGGGGGP